MIQNIFLGLFLLFTIWSLIHIIGVVSDGKFMDWTEYFKKKLGLSNFVAGETIQALGTSAPEISISFLGLYIFQENPALGLATVIGSAIFQITVVIGVPLLFASNSAQIEYKGLLRTSLAYGGSVVLLYIFLTTGKILEWWELATLTAYHVAYLIYIIRGHKSSGESEPEMVHPEEPPAQPSILKHVDNVLHKIPSPEDKFAFFGPIPLGFFLTLIIIAIACAFFIEAAAGFAVLVGISPNFIALTILAGGSSVPELFSNIPLAKKGNIDQAIGNAFGSNTLDICVSFAFISIPYAFFNGGVSGDNVEKMTIPIYFLFGYLFVVLALFTVTKFKTHKWQGWVLNGLFLIFVMVSYYYEV